MPELPDIEVFSFNLKRQFAGKKLEKITVVNGKKLKDSQQKLSKALHGKTLVDVCRSGKEIRFAFQKNILLSMHLMLTGDLYPFDKEYTYKSTIVEMHFDGGQGLALTNRMKNANVKLNLVDKDGIDALSKDLNFKYLKNAFGRKSIVKNILLDQNIIRGIGNGYSDEILWQAGISPFSIANAIPNEKLKNYLRSYRKY